MIAAAKPTPTLKDVAPLDQGGPIFVSNRKPSSFARKLLAELEAQDRRPVQTRASEVLIG